METTQKVSFADYFGALKSKAKELQDTVAQIRLLQDKNTRELQEIVVGFAELQSIVAPIRKELEYLSSRGVELANWLEISKKYGVVPSIHSEDFIYQFMLNHAQFVSDPKLPAEHYFSTGDESAKKLIALKRELGISRKVSLLEFASGFGCVTRHLVKYPHEFEITSCDIHEKAMEFIEHSMNVCCTRSYSAPEKFQTPKQYTIVFALSFFSHMPRKSWAKWLATLYRSVEPGGYLIFTTHGLVSQKSLVKNAVLDESGFWFTSNSEQKDLDSAEYGTTITSPAFVRQAVKGLENVATTILHEGHWWGHQDAWVLKKAE